MTFEQAPTSPNENFGYRQSDFESLLSSLCNFENPENALEKANDAIERAQELEPEKQERVRDMAESLERSNILPFLKDALMAVEQINEGLSLTEIEFKKAVEMAKKAIDAEKRAGELDLKINEKLPEQIKNNLRGIYDVAIQMRQELQKEGDENTLKELGPYFTCADELLK
ncbi:MAG: hypothetical protein N4A36_00170 [Candidatus Gracilibacteria bacterium]|jgi:type I restriction-modification system DNA methylase subunit|nr:hypothetical protein [Candidatus Gracilibacteria bacterium]